MENLGYDVRVGLRKLAEALMDYVDRENLEVTAGYHEETGELTFAGKVGAREVNSLHRGFNILRKEISDLVLDFTGIRLRTQPSAVLSMVKGVKVKEVRLPSFLEQLRLVYRM